MFVNGFLTAEDFLAVTKALHSGKGLVLVQLAREQSSQYFVHVSLNMHTAEIKGHSIDHFQLEIDAGMFVA